MSSEQIWYGIISICPAAIFVLICGAFRYHEYKQKKRVFRLLTQQIELERKKYLAALSVEFDDQGNVLIPNALKEENGQLRRALNELVVRAPLQPLMRVSPEEKSLFLLAASNAMRLLKSFDQKGVGN